MHLNLEKVTSLAESVATPLGLRVYHLEMVGSGNGKILRIFIDRTQPRAVDTAAETEVIEEDDVSIESSGDVNKVSLKDCSDFSKALSEKLDSEDPIEGAYHLEVSSPGVERVLVQMWHFQESVGENIYVQLNKPLADISSVDQKHGSRKKITGVLKSLSDEKLSIDFENTNVIVPFQNVSKAHVVFDFGNNTIARKRATMTKE